MHSPIPDARWNVNFYTKSTHSGTQRTSVRKATTQNTNKRKQVLWNKSAWIQFVNWTISASGGSFCTMCTMRKAADKAVVRLEFVCRRRCRRRCRYRQGVSVVIEVANTFMRVLNKHRLKTLAIHAQLHKQSVFICSLCIVSPSATLAAAMSPFASLIFFNLQ